MARVRRERRIAAGVAVAALAVAALVLLTTCDRSVAVPDVIGLTLEEAQTRIADARLIAGDVAYDAASALPLWTVISQSPTGTVEPKTRVNLVLAGAAPTTVPAVVGKTQAEALAALVASALATPTVTLEFGDAAAEGLVLSQEPTAGATVPSGATAKLVVGGGAKPADTDTVKMTLVEKFSGSYSPKSVVATQNGYVFAQNMMYRHTIAVFSDATYELVKSISDGVKLADFGYPEYGGTVQGAPVEAAVTPDGEYVYVSQYSMYGPGFSHPGDDDLGPGSGVDPSFVYRVPTDTLAIDQVIKVGSVPKYVAVTPDGKYVLVSNWVSFDLSVIDVAQGKEIKRIKLGRYPRGIVVDAASRVAYVAVMGSSDIAKVNLGDFSVSWFRGVGSNPRHLCISPDGKYLYATLNASGQVIKIELPGGQVVGRVTTGTQTRSMAIAEDGRSLYVVNYESSSMSKVRTSDMSVLQTVAVGTHPIGVTYVNARREVWVCCYGGSFHIFRDPAR